jgi:hypothetical protein
LVNASFSYKFGNYKPINSWPINLDYQLDHSGWVAIMKYNI